MIVGNVLGSEYTAHASYPTGTEGLAPYLQHILPTLNHRIEGLPGNPFFNGEIRDSQFTDEQRAHIETLKNTNYVHHARLIWGEAAAYIYFLQKGYDGGSFLSRVVNLPFEADTRQISMQFGLQEPSRYAWKDRGHPWNRLADTYGVARPTEASVEARTQVLSTVLQNYGTEDPCKIEISSPRHVFITTPEQAREISSGLKKTYGAAAAEPDLYIFDTYGIRSKTSGNEYSRVRLLGFVETAVQGYMLISSKLNGTRTLLTQISDNHQKYEVIKQHALRNLSEELGTDPKRSIFSIHNHLTLFFLSLTKFDPKTIDIPDTYHLPFEPHVPHRNIKLIVSGTTLRVPF
jgi:hypothetical protein